MPKKILFFIGGSYVAGMEIVTLLLIRGLKEKGYEVRCVVNGWSDGDFKKRLTDMDVPYYEVKLGWLYWRKPSWTLGTLVNYPKAYRICKRAILEFQPDIINFTSYSIAIMLYPLITDKSFYILHDTQLPNLKHRVIYKLLIRKLKHFIAVSGHIANTLKNLSVPEERITTIYNGVIPPSSSSQNRHPGKTILSFGIVGQVSEAKGHLVLLEAAELLVKKGTRNFKIVIVGNNKNDFSKQLAGQIREKDMQPFFEWTGFVRNAERIYDGIDVVVVPSLCTEAFSLATAEAMIRGLGTIASDRGGIKELVDPGKTGLLFAPGDATELSECMQRLIDDRGYIEYLGSNAVAKATADFSGEAMTQKYIEAYRKAYTPSQVITV